MLKGDWKGMTIFRMPGPNEVDYGVEPREIRNAFTDSCYVGQGREGSMDIYLIGKGAFEMVLLEDNQATIRILESGRSPACRHADKTQRQTLTWLAEQFQRKHFTLVYVPSLLQAADIFTKPFTSAEKWNQLLKLLGLHSASKKSARQTKLDAPHPGGPVAAATPGAHYRVLLEVCSFIAIEWPKNCVYWKLEYVLSFCQRYSMDQVTFDGCMIGVVDVRGAPIKKPWKIRTNLEPLIKSFTNMQCDESHEHAEGRGESLKSTETYTFQMTDIDMIHRAFGVAISN